MKYTQIANDSLLSLLSDNLSLESQNRSLLERAREAESALRDYRSQTRWIAEYNSDLVAKLNEQEKKLAAFRTREILIKGEAGEFAEQERLSAWEQGRVIGALDARQGVRDWLRNEADKCESKQRARAKCLRELADKLEEP